MMRACHDTPDRRRRLVPFHRHRRVNPARARHRFGGLGRACRPARRDPPRRDRRSERSRGQDRGRRVLRGLRGADRRHLGCHRRTTDSIRSSPSPGPSAIQPRQGPPAKALHFSEDRQRLGVRACTRHGGDRSARGWRRRAGARIAGQPTVSSGRSASCSLRSRFSIYRIRAETATERFGADRAARCPG